MSSESLDEEEMKAVESECMLTVRLFNYRCTYQTKATDNQLACRVCPSLKIPKQSGCLG